MNFTLISKITLSLIICVSCFSCGRKEKEINDPISGKILERYEYIETENGSQLKDGHYKAWYPNGQVKVDGFFEKNKRTGEWKAYYDNGTLNELAHFLNDQMEGKRELYFPNGKKYSESEYLKDKQQGLVKEWYDNGQLSQEYSTVAGIKDGKYDSYFINGKQKESEFFKNGNPDGDYSLYFESGILSKKGAYKTGKKNGAWLTNNSHGDIFMQEEYEDGDNISLVGKWKVNDSFVVDYFRDGTAMNTAANGQKTKAKYSITDNYFKYSFNLYSIEKLTHNEYTISTEKVFGKKVYHGVRVN